MSDIDDVKVRVRKTPDPDLLEKMADANEQTADLLVNGASVGGFGPPPDMVGAILRTIAMAQRKLAKDTRDGKHVREGHSTDG